MNKNYRLRILPELGLSEIITERLDIYECREIAYKNLKRNKHCLVHRINLKTGEENEFELVNNKYVRIKENVQVNALKSIKKSIDNGYISMNEADNKEEFIMLKKIIYTFINK